MGDWFISGLLFGSGIDFIYGVTSVLGIFNTSVQGISNVSSIIRKNNECEDIKNIFDNELLLEVRIRVLEYFFQDIKKIKFSKKNKEILELLIKKITMCVKDIYKQLDEINKKIIYNKKIWLFAMWRKYGFEDDEKIIRNKSAQLEQLENKFYKIIEMDLYYIQYKKENQQNYEGVEYDRLTQSTLLSSQIFG
jgi:hypothetical protein